MTGRKWEGRKSCCVFAPISRNGSSLDRRSQTLIFALMCVREQHAEARERPCWSRTPLTSLTPCQECEDTLTYSRGRVLGHHSHRLDVWIHSGCVQACLVDPVRDQVQLTLLWQSGLVVVNTGWPNELLGLQGNQTLTHAEQVVPYLLTDEGGQIYRCSATTGEEGNRGFKRLCLFDKVQCGHKLRVEEERQIHLR